MRTFKIRGRLKEGQARGIQKRRARKTLGIRNYAETIRFYSYLPTDPEVVLLVMLPWVGCDADERGGFESAPASVLLVQQRQRPIVTQAVVVLLASFCFRVRR
jgi:hypothetical protein